jgi:hypothetical protein
MIAGREHAMSEAYGRRSFAGFAMRAMVVHTATYFLFGMFMSNLFRLRARLSDGDDP